MRPIAAVLALVAGVFSADAAFADTLVCRNGKTVEPGMTTIEVIDKCGEPTSKESKTEDVRAKGPAGGSVKVGESVTETWRYDRGSQKQTAVLTVRDGKVVSISYED
jgi:hypothetical protein